jgi:DNA-binding GntR family transcriptional regulator
MLLRLAYLRVGHPRAARLPPRWGSDTRSRDPNRDMVTQHREIAERTLARDEDKAAAEPEQHIERTTSLLIAQLNREGPDATNHRTPFAAV